MQAVKELLEDLLDPNPDERLGCRSKVGAHVTEDIEHHSFYKGFNFIALGDCAVEAPYYTDCHGLATAFFTKQAASRGTFDAPPYVGDNRWCDDWDYTCTIGATVEAAQVDDTSVLALRGSNADVPAQLPSANKPMATDSKPSA